MGSGIVTRRIIPTLVACAGSTVAAEPVNSPPRTGPQQSGVIVSKPLLISSEQPPIPGLKLVPTVPDVLNAPAEPAPPPGGGLPLAGEKYGPPPPATLPPGAPGIFSAPADLYGAPVFHPGLSWARAEYLFWYLTGGHVQPLATTGPAEQPIAVPGFPGQTVLFGGNSPLEDPRSGARLTLGTWLDDCRTIGVEASAFWVSQHRSGYIDGSQDGSRVLAASPSIDPTTNLPTAVLISFPNVTAGVANITFTGRSIWGAEALLRPLLTAGPGWRIDGLVGYRYRRLSERLDIQEALFPLAPPFVPGTMIVSNDDLRTDNEFQGGVLGVDCEKDCGGWLINVRPSIGIGRMFSTVDRSGATLIRVPGASDLLFPGGTYNLTSNLGRVHSNDCTVIPELDLRISKAILDCLRLSVGYSAIYFPNLARVGEQIDPFVNPNLVPPAVGGGPARPAPIVEHSSAWLHGFTLGLELRY